MRLQDMAVNVSSANVTMTTTSETAIINVTGVREVYGGCQVFILAWAQFTTGASTTGMIPRIRRGTTTAGTVVNENNTEQVFVAAGSTESKMTMGYEVRSNEDSLSYCLTLQGVASSADNTVLQAGIVVMVF